MYECVFLPPMLHQNVFCICRAMDDSVCGDLCLNPDNRNIAVLFSIKYYINHNKSVPYVARSRQTSLLHVKIMKKLCSKRHSVTAA